MNQKIDVSSVVAIGVVVCVLILLVSITFGLCKTISSVYKMIVPVHDAANNLIMAQEVERGIVESKLIASIVGFNGSALLEHDTLTEVIEKIEASFGQWSSILDASNNLNNEAKGLNARFAHGNAYTQVAAMAETIRKAMHTKQLHSKLATMLSETAMAFAEIYRELKSIKGKRERLNNRWVADHCSELDQLTPLLEACGKTDLHIDLLIGKVLALLKHLKNDPEVKKWSSKLDQAFMDSLMKENKMERSDELTRAVDVILSEVPIEDVLLESPESVEKEDSLTTTPTTEPTTEPTSKGGGDEDDDAYLM